MRGMNPSVRSYVGSTFAIVFILSFPVLLFAATSIPDTIAVMRVGATSSVQAERILHIGMRGDDVAQLQTDLSALDGIYPGKIVSGYYGELTAAAVRRFQAKERMVATGTAATTGYGQAGRATLMRLRLVKISIACDSTRPDYLTCLNDYYADYAKRNATAEALLLLTAAIKRDPAFGLACHTVMHQIGHAGAREYKTLGSAFTKGSPECQNGYYHGVVEELLGSIPIDSVSADDLRGYCANAKLSSSSTFAELNCIHGVGHALIFMTHNDLPGALVRCYDFLNDKTKSECSAGAFMQNALAGNPHATSSEVGVDVLSAICAQAAGDQSGCWLWLGALQVAKKDGNTTRAAALCTTLESPLYREQCLQKITQS